MLPTKLGDDFVSQVSAVASAIAAGRLSFCKTYPTRFAQLTVHRYQYKGSKVPGRLLCLQLHAVAKALLYHCLCDWS